MLSAQTPTALLRANSCDPRRPDALPTSLGVISSAALVALLRANSCDPRRPDALPTSLA
jgi:hypothetical protein